MKNSISVIFLTLFITSAALSKKKTTADLGSSERPLILNANNSKIKKEYFKLFDAIYTSDLNNIEYTQIKESKTPIFFIPKPINLVKFFKEPLKTRKNSPFTFGLTLTLDTVERCKSLLTAFNTAFGERKDVALSIYIPPSKKSDTQKKLTEQFSHLAKKNFFFFKGSQKKNSEMEFYRNLDCYINLSPSSLSSSCKALALGTPLLTVQANSIFVSSNHAAFIDLNLPNQELQAADSLLELYQDYDLRLAQAPETRDWIRNFISLHNKSVKEKEKNLIRPNKLILGKCNVVDETSLETASLQLYQKYLNATPPPASIERNNLYKYVRSLDPPKISSGLQGIDCIYVINLDERPERWDAARTQFLSQSIIPYRVSAINGWKIPKAEAGQLFDKRSPLLAEAFGGALGCLLSHLSIYKNALDRGFETVWICEDDIQFNEDAKKIPLLLKQLSELDPEWDILYTDSCLRTEGLQQPRPNQSLYTPVYSQINDDLVKIHGRFNTHSMIFSQRGLKKVYAYFTHGLLWSPIDIDIHYVPGIREYSTSAQLVTSIHDSSILSCSSDTQALSSLRQRA